MYKFYYSDTEIVPKYNNPYGVDVTVSDGPGDAYGKFHYGPLGQLCEITIYNHNRSSERVFGTVCHELGHFVHYGEREGYSGYHGVEGLIKESFASYVGWLLGRSYYLGYYDEDITGQGRQAWDYKSSDKYAPLFVDLVDTYSQEKLPENISISYNSYFFIQKVIKKASDWNSCKAELRNQAGSAVSYTLDQINKYIPYYDTWFNNN